MYSKKFKTDYGKIVNCFIGAIGIICILLLAIVSGCGSSGIDEADNIEKVSSLNPEKYFEKV